MARNRKGQFSRRKTRTRRKKTTNVLSIAESALLANAVTSGMFGTDLKEFLTGTVDGKYNPSRDGANIISLPELIGLGASGQIGGNYGTSSFQEAVMSNLKKNGMQMAMQLIGIPIAFRVGSKLLKKPRASANKLMRDVGLDGVRV
jgi:hypothetical protein